MKKVVAVLLAMTMVLAFAACGDDSKKESGFVKVSFDTDGGSQITAMEIKKGSTVVQPENPTKEGYKFLGWIKDGAAFDFSSAVDSDITLTATWADEGSNPDIGGNDGKTPDDSGNGTKPDSGSNNVSVETLAWVNSWYWVQEGTVGDPELTVVPESARSSVKFSSSDEKIAVVDEKGNVKGVSGGKVTITASCGDKKAELTFEVKPLPTGVKLDKHQIEFTTAASSYPGAKIVATVEPETAHNKTVKWSFSDPSIAHLSDEGRIIWDKIGTTTLTATDIMGHSDSCTIYVNGVTLFYELNTDTVDLYNGAEVYITLAETINGATTYKDVTSQCVMDQYPNDGYLEFVASSGILKCLKNPGSDITREIHFRYTYSNSEIGSMGVSTPAAYITVEKY